MTLQVGESEAILRQLIIESAQEGADQVRPKLPKLQTLKSPLLKQQTTVRGLYGSLRLMCMYFCHFVLSLCASHY